MFRFLRRCRQALSAAQKNQRAVVRPRFAFPPGLCSPGVTESYSSKSINSPIKHPVSTTPPNQEVASSQAVVIQPDYDFSHIQAPHINDPATWEALNKLIPLLEDDGMFWDFNNAEVKFKLIVDKVRAFKRFVGVPKINIFVFDTLQLLDENTATELRAEGCIFIKLFTAPNMADQWMLWVMSLWATRRLGWGPWSGDLNFLSHTLSFGAVPPLVLQRRLKAVVLSGDHCFANLLSQMPGALVTRYVIVSLGRLSSALEKAADVIGYIQNM